MSTRTEPSLMFKLTFQWFLTFLSVPDFSRPLSRCAMKLPPYLMKRRFFASGSEANHLFQTFVCLFVSFGVFFCLHQPPDPWWLFCNIWYIIHLFLSHLLVMFTCGCWGGICLFQAIDGAKNNIVRLFRD